MCNPTGSQGMVRVGDDKPFSLQNPSEVVREPCHSFYFYKVKINVVSISVETTSVVALQRLFCFSPKRLPEKENGWIQSSFSFQ